MTTSDYDVVIVGGGPAGCSAGVFCAREGLETGIFDRGNSSIRRCAHLDNYLGFPRGIDVETFYGLMHAHAEWAGCEIVADFVESLERDGDGFRVHRQEGDPVTARRVIAATRYDGEYMRGLDDDVAMFETHTHDEHEHFDGGYAAHDGTTPVEGLYIASPSDEDSQAIVAAGRGARVAKRVIADAKVDDGWWVDVAEGVDWVRWMAELDDEWNDRDKWVAWFDDFYASAAPIEPGTERFDRVREAYIEDRLSMYVTDREIEGRAAKGHESLASHLDVEAIVEAVDEERILAAIDDEAIREYVERPSTPEGR